MSAKLFQLQSNTQAIAGSPTKVALAAATLKTVLQVATPATQQIRIVEWGISFDANAAGVPVIVELIDTGAIAATVTAAAATDITKLNDPNAAASLVTLSTTATGYNASAEGTITTARTLSQQLVAPTNQYVEQYPLGREPEVAVSRILRIRCNAPAVVNCTAYIVWEE